MRKLARNSHVIGSQAGTSLAEVMVTIGIVTGLMGVGVLSLERGFMNLPMAKQNLVNDLRKARMQATLKGAHFRFDAGSNQYVITRLSDQDGDGSWESNEDFTPMTVELPSGYSVVVSSSGSSAFAEFDGRGLLVPQDDGSLSIVTVTVTGDSGRSEVIQIWPSGQVEDAAGTATTTG